MAVTKTKSAPPASPSREVLKLTSRLIRRRISQHLPAPREQSMPETDIELSIVVPFFNEERSVDALFDHLLPVLQGLNCEFEIIATLNID